MFSFRSKFIKLTPAIIALLFILFGSRWMMLSEAAEDKYVIQWEIDRTAIPRVSVNDITLNVAVGVANAISAVDENGEELPTVYNEPAGVVSITTAGDFIELTFFTETAGNPLIGSYVPATLKNDFEWAWSHGIDDNINLEGSIGQFQKRNWVGTLFLLGERIEQANSGPNRITAGRVQELMAEGWSIGNHTYAYDDCEARPGEYEQSILDGQEVIDSIIAGSSKPEYSALSLAAPCFLNGFHPALISLRDSGAISLRVNESGDNLPLILDQGALNQFIEDQQVNVFNVDSPVGRDGTIDEGSLDETIRRIDWVARHSNNERHLWYNSVSHGENEDNRGVEARLGGLVEYVYREYGPLGTNEVWVAPSDHIVSYVLVRDFAKFNVMSVSRNSEPLERSSIRPVAPNSAGNLESSGFLPTRIRPTDTPIAIAVEVIEANTPVPTETATPAPTIAPTDVFTEVQATAVAEVSETVDDGNGNGDATGELPPIEDPIDLDQADNMANIAVWSVMITAALISLALLGILIVIALRFWRTRAGRKV